MRRAVLATLLLAVGLAFPGMGYAEEPQGGAEALPPPAAPPPLRAEPREDRSDKAPDLRAGTFEVRVHDAFSRPVAGIQVELGVLFQDPAEGETRKQLLGTTNPEGVVLFSGLTVGTDHTYRAVVSQGPAAFASESIRLDALTGHRVLLHVYPSTPDIKKALIGMRGLVYIQPRDDVFQIEGNFQVFNIGPTAWVPSGLSLPLPDGAKAVRAQESMQDARIEKTIQGDLILTGTFGPGQRDVGYQFQLPNTHDPARSFRLALPPHVAEMRVIGEGPRSMTLSVAGFDAAEETRGKDGARLLVAGRRMTQGDAALGHVEIALAGLPVPSSGRWYAAGLALLLAVLGLAAHGRQAPRAGSGDGMRRETEEAEGLVLDELVALELLHRDGTIGPRTYESSRADLVEALARLAARRAAVTDADRQAQERPV